MVSYNYDAWGNVVSKFFFKYGVANAKINYSITLGTTVYTAQDIDNLNSHYYRGYYYDKETGFYYLTTRYYDPKTGRFISPDDPRYLDYSIAYGHNRYAYCVNNPVMFEDPEGNSITVALLIIGAIVGVAVGVGIAAYNDYQDDAEVNGSIGWYNYLGSAILGGIIGAGIGAGIGAIAGTSFTVTIPTIGSILTGGGTAAATTAVTITVSGEVVAGAVGTGVIALGGYVLYKGSGPRIGHNGYEKKQWKEAMRQLGYENDKNMQRRLHYELHNYPYQPKLKGLLKVLREILDKWGY